MSDKNEITNSKFITLRNNLCIFAIAIILSILAGESFFRIFMKDKLVLFPRYYTDVQYGDYTLRRLIPNTEYWHTSPDGTWKFHINSQGFRNDRDFSYEKTPGTLRVLVIGDSNVQGYEVRQDQTLSVIMERYLQKAGITAEVINAGVSGFSTAEELLFLENEGIKYQPDVVVLGFNYNDYIDNIRAGLFSLHKGRLITEEKRTYIPGVRILNIINSFAITRWLGQNSYLYSYVLNKTWYTVKRIITSKAKKNISAQNDKKKKSVRANDQNLIFEEVIPKGKVQHYDAALVSGIIGRMYEFCKKNNIYFIILDLPTPYGEANYKEIRSSVLPGLIDTFNNNSDSFIYSKDMFHEYEGLIQLTVPNGQHHISEFSHLIYGIKSARIILDANKSNPF